MHSSNRIIINTIAQYLRAVLNIIFSFLATRVILKVLGVEDYGIYTLVAGVISILSFITSSLVITTQRYLSICQGENNLQKSKSIFGNSLILHLIIGGGIIIILETLYPLLFNNFLNIPETRIYSTKILYHIVVSILFFTFISSPFKAILISHENILYLSIIETIDCVLKLVIAYLLYIINLDKLIAYGLLMLFIQLFNLVTLSTYCFYKYKECALPNIQSINTKYLKELSSFAGWTMYNLICNLGRTQGISILLNKYMGPTINTAYGLGFQVSGALGNLSQSLLNAINPQLMKAEGGGDRNKMLRYAEIESKFAFFLLSAVAIPCVFEMPLLLDLWLDKVPSYSVLFCRMIIIAALVDNLTIGLGAANQAIGNIKEYVLIIYTIKFLTLFACIIILYCGYDLLFVTIAYVVFELLSSICRIPFMIYTANLDLRKFYNNVFLKEIVPFIVLLSSCIILTSCIDNNHRFIYTFGISIILYIYAIYYCGLCKDEKEIINSCLIRFKKRLNN